MSENIVQNKKNNTDLNLDSNSRMAYKEIDIAVPITIEPNAILGEAYVEIIDEPCIIPVPRCMERRNCRYALRQRLCVTFPIEFNASLSSGDPFCCMGDNCSNKEFSNNVANIINQHISADVKEKEVEFKKEEIENKESAIEIANNTIENIVIENKKNKQDDSNNFIFQKKGKRIEIKI